MFIKSCLINGADVKSHVIAFNATNIFVYKVLAISLLQFCIFFSSIHSKPNQIS